MDEKRKILELLFPKAVLKPLTPQAHEAVPVGMQVKGLVTIHEFPFKVGRESRTTMVDNRLHRLERPVVPGTRLNNDLYLLDSGDLLQISREHFQINKTVDGYLLVDRGSKCGVSINGKRVGGQSGEVEMKLNDGDVIGIGTVQTLYLFTFIADFDESHW